MIKKTSWLYVIVTPSRWKEAVNYFINRRVVGNAYDRPDPRDLDAPKLFTGSLVKLPKKFSLSGKAVKLGWTGTKQSKNACTAYSKGHGVEVTNTVNHQERVIINKEKQWENQRKTGASRDSGDSIQNAEYAFHKYPQGLPQTEYRRVRGSEKTVRGIKLWLLRMETVRTGLYWKWSTEERKTNSRFMKETGFFTEGNGKILGGHACFIDGWDDTQVSPDGSIGAFLMYESELETWGENPAGYFWVSYDKIEHLFSKYISRDMIDKE